MLGLPRNTRPWLAGGLLLLASCGENILGPLDGTTFVLRTIDGQPLPATAADAFGGLAWIVEADTVWLEGGSRWRRHSVQRREEGVGGDPLDIETGGRVTLRDGLFILDFACDDGDCIAPDRFVGSPLLLEMEQTYLHAGRNLVFEPT